MSSRPKSSEQESDLFLKEKLVLGFQRIKVILLCSTILSLRNESFSYGVALVMANAMSMTSIRKALGDIMILCVCVCNIREIGRDI